MTSHALPRHIDGQRFCQQGVRVGGAIDLTDLSRLMELVYKPEGSIRADMVFGLDEQYRRIIGGTVDVSISLTCQRCLQEMPWSYQGSFKLALVLNDEQAAQLPRELDAVMLPDGDTGVDLFAIVEEEILLALPLAAQHEPGGCNPPSAGIDVEEEPHGLFEKKNPFQVLASLKTTVKPRDDSSQ